MFAKPLCIKIKLDYTLSTVAYEKIILVNSSKHTTGQSCLLSHYRD